MNQTKTFLLTGLATIVMLGSAGRVAAQSVDLTAQRLRGGKGISVTLTPSSSAEGCSYDLLASFRQRALSVVRPVLSGIEGSSSSVSRVALKLPTLDISSDSGKGKKLFFRAVLRCPGATSESADVSVKPKTASSGGVGRRRYLRALKRQFNQGPNRYASGTR
jgi:hypothetical protein